MSAKEEIIELFYKNVKGKKSDVSNCNERHDGKYGHWLEHQFGVHSNDYNCADIMGYELKNETTSGKTSFGDWSANEYVYTSPEYRIYFSGRTTYEKREDFLQIFGKPNEEKGGRCSWSGSPCPKIDFFNDFGQKLIVDTNKDILAIYSYSKDKRSDKSKIVPSELQIENLVLARWYGETAPVTKKRVKCLKAKLEDKFNDKGWFTCKTDKNGLYDKICFGRPMNYDEWIELVKLGIVYFDSGMHQGNRRPYSQWRADNTFWNSLIEETYE